MAGIRIKHALWIFVAIFLILPLGNFEAWGQMRPKADTPNRGGSRMANMMEMMQKIYTTYTDTENGGVYRACSENLSTVTDSTKLALDQFVLARSYVFQHMLSGQPQPQEKATELADFALEKFRDNTQGGYYSRASKDWTIVNKEKDPVVMGEIVGTLMHLYEITYDDTHLLKAFEVLDILLEKCEDKEHGGFFDAYTEDWNPASQTKSLHTQMQMIQHLGGGWKDGLDSPYAVKAEFYKDKSMELANLVIDKMLDREQGGFFKSCNADWSVKDDSKDPEEIASAVTSLFFNYHNRGPVIWGPRPGSHAYSPNRVIHDVYSYRGPGPDPRPISMDAYRVGKLVVENAKLLAEKAVDRTHGGFYRTLSRNWEPLDKSKSASTQAAVQFALNIAYKMTGDEPIRKTLSDSVAAAMQKASDPAHGGYYESYTEDWAPASKEKTFEATMQVMSIMGMVMPTITGPEVTLVKLKVWIEPQMVAIKDGATAHYKVTVQNQGFFPEKVRIGGMFALTRWMDPQESVVELEPHQVLTYDLKMTPPKGLTGKSYAFEISAISQRDRIGYVSDTAILDIR
jgi:mannose/cellobiose epimerase-like protein (N-acyl-D-glucosamine 2-epimerase family)